MKKEINDLIAKKFNSKPRSIEKMTTGLCNEVYLIALESGDEVILRFNENDEYMRGSSLNIPLFKEKGIDVPDIIFEDYSKKDFPFSYQILSKIEGRDMGEVFSELSISELKEIAKSLSKIIKSVKDIPTNRKSGSWLEFIIKMQKDIKTRNKKTSVLNEGDIEMLDSIIEKYTPYFKSVKSTVYYDDMCTKNVMIDNGKFKGLVDLDYIEYGDYLEAIGRIKAAYFKEENGDFYLNELIKNLEITDKEKEVINIYAILNLIYWTTEQGIQFNSNTTSKVDWNVVGYMKQKIKELHENIK